LIYFIIQNYKLNYFCNEYQVERCCSISAVRGLAPFPSWEFGDHIEKEEVQRDLQLHCDQAVGEFESEL
jgi:hypothetical protein